MIKLHATFYRRHTLFSNKYHSIQIHTLFKDCNCFLFFFQMQKIEFLFLILNEKTRCQHINSFAY